MIEKLISKRVVYNGVVGFVVDRVMLPDKKIAKREYMRHPGAVAGVAIKNGRIILVKQYRHPVRRITYELPAGKIDRNESPIKCMKREFEEETGYRFSSYRKLISYNPTPAFSDEVIHIYLLKGIKKGRFNPDRDEFIEVVEVPVKEVIKMIDKSEITDSKTIIGVLMCLKEGCLRG